MKRLDRVLQRWRENIARPWIPSGADLLDVGCHQGEFMHRLGPRIRSGIGYDPLAEPRDGRIRLIAAPFVPPTTLPDRAFDAIVMLATLEHVRDKTALGPEFARLLRPKGRVIITVPSPAVDAIVHTLVRCRLADGMALDEHHGFQPRRTPCLFEPHGLKLERHRPFQLGLNHLYVFRKIG